MPVEDFAGLNSSRSRKVNRQYRRMCRYFLLDELRVTSVALGSWALTDTFSLRWHLFSPRDSTMRN